jgi:hypothetical protein
LAALATRRPPRSLAGDGGRCVFGDVDDAGEDKRLDVGHDVEGVASGGQPALADERGDEAVELADRDPGERSGVARAARSMTNGRSSAAKVTMIEAAVAPISGAKRTIA